MDEICRLCCSTKFVNNNIFDEKNALFIKMSLHMPIKLRKGDRLPQRICDNCSCKVNDFYQFCNEAIEVQNKFKVIFAFDKKELESSIDLTLIKRDTSSPLLRCDKTTQTPEQNGTTHHPDSPVVPIKEEPKTSISPVKQEVSDEEYIPAMPSDSEDELLSNIKSNKQSNGPKITELENCVVQNLRKRTRKSKDVWNRNLLPAKLLMQNDVNILDAQVNLNVVKQEAVEVKPQDLGVDLDALDIRESPFYCCICFIQSDTKAKMLHHYKSHVIKSELQEVPTPIPALPDESPFRCQRCRKTVESEGAWAAHWRRHWVRDRRPYRCGLCEKTFRDHRLIFKHGQTHKVGETHKADPRGAALNLFICDTCPEVFSYMKCLQAHRTRAHPEAAARPLQLRCGLCSRAFAHLNSLRRHQRSHTGERNHLCNVCGKALSSREHLKFHIRIHTGYKPNVCGVCGKGFVKKCNLTLHERVHSGEKPHVCSHCGKAFSQRSTLVIHERYHSGARPYECKLCGRGFVAKGLLSMHLKTACVEHPPPADKMCTRS